MDRVRLLIDEEALGHGYLVLEAENDIPTDENLSEKIEEDTGLQFLEISPNKELVFLDQGFVGDPEEELDFLIKQAKHFRGRYDLPQLGLENLTLEEVFKAIKEHCLKDFTIPKLTTPTQK